MPSSAAISFAVHMLADEAQDRELGLTEPRQSLPRDGVHGGVVRVRLIGHVNISRIG